jgi:hypothetical protein
MAKKKKEVLWEDQAADDDYKAARQYLSLLFTVDEARGLEDALRRASTQQFPAKDILRASQTHLLDDDNGTVRESLKKIKKGEKLSPVLLVRGDGISGATLTIADGYHRICASWQWDEKAPISCCLVNLPSFRKKGKC